MWKPTRITTCNKLGYVELASGRRLLFGKFPVRSRGTEPKSQISYRFSNQSFYLANLKSVTTLHCSDCSGQNVFAALTRENWRLRKKVVTDMQLWLAVLFLSQGHVSWGMEVTVGVNDRITIMDLTGSCVKMWSGLNWLWRRWHFGHL
jgi:hypothetical protein